MLVKNWLIRTKNNHILGPVSKEKIKELLNSGSIKGDDEVTSGNGYWLYVREEELLEKYIFGDTAQSFNPVQEAMPSIISSFPPDYNLLKNIPEESLVQHNQVNQTLITKNPLANESDGDLADSNTPEPVESSGESPEEKKKQKRVIKRRKPGQNQVNEKKKIPQGLNLNNIMVLTLIILVLIFSGLWYKKNVLEQVGHFSNLLIPSANAQDFDEKKKSGFQSKK